MHDWTYELVEPLEKYDMLVIKLLVWPVRLQECAGVYHAASADI